MKTIESMGFGYCDWDTSIEAGVNLIDRVTVPIRDIDGEVVGFGGRIVGQREGPKYINSPTSRAYDKSKILYNLDIARDYILESGDAILTEGYMDTALLVESGVNNVVASCGTSITKYHVRLLKRFSERIILMMDSDKAGEKSVERAIGTCSVEKHPVYIATLPFWCKDPADLAVASGKEGVEEIVRSAQKAFIG